MKRCKGLKDFFNQSQLETKLILVFFIVILLWAKIQLHKFFRFVSHADRALQRQYKGATSIIAFNPSDLNS